MAENIADIKIKIKDIVPNNKGGGMWGVNAVVKYGEPVDHDGRQYSWYKLEASIKEHGYDPKKFDDYIILDMNNWVICGQHRVVLLKELYGEDYEVNVKKANCSRPDWQYNKYEAWQSSRSLQHPCDSRGWLLPHDKLIDNNVPCFCDES